MAALPRSETKEEDSSQPAGQAVSCIGSIHVFCSFLLASYACPPFSTPLSLHWTGHTDIFFERVRRGVPYLFIGSFIRVKKYVQSYKRIQGKQCPKKKQKKYII